ncbi:MAG: F0F1 ATP synthase subunit B [Phycisphaerae bacterium]
MSTTTHVLMKRHVSTAFMGTVMRDFQRCLILMAIMLMPSAAFAAGDGGSNPFAGDIGNMIWSLVIFLLVLFMLGKFAWPPILKGLQDREKFIVESLESAKRDRDEAQKILAEHEERISKAREEASAIVEEGRRDAEVLRRSIEDDARAEAQKIADRTKQELELAKDNAIKQLYDLSGKLGTEIASRIIKKEIRAEDHERLIAESIDELKKVV